jgi:protocatechuate 3,4-dioxygenase beta subunit
LTLLAAAHLAAAAAWGQTEASPWLPPPDAPSEIVIARPAAGEQELVVAGQVFHPDGETPAPGVVLYVYHTDARGYYRDRPGSPMKYHGWMRTDREGRYRYRTIRPAQYPSRTVSAHVHTQLWGERVPAQWNQDLLFADDPLVSAEERQRSRAAGRFAFVCDGRRDSAAALTCTHNLRLKPRGDAFEESIRHGLRGPDRGTTR